MFAISESTLFDAICRGLFGRRKRSTKARIGPSKRTILNVRPSHATKDENYYLTVTKPKHLRAA